MLLDEIYRKENLSVRSYNVCKENNLNSVKDLIEYYNKHQSFYRLRKCGKKSNEELIEICNKHQGDLIDNGEFENKEENLLVSIISKLTREQREVVNSFIYVNTNSLSVRSKNGISIYLNGNLKIKNFTEKILASENFSIKRIKNVGVKCIPELEIYISSVKEFLIQVSQTNDEKHLISLKNKFLIQRTYNITEIPDKILESESIFLLTDFLLNQNIFFDQTETTIFKKAFKIYQNQIELSLDKIAEEVNLTRERIRQKRIICLNELFNKLLFIQNFNDDLFQKYNIDINSTQIELNSDDIDAINDANDINLSREFIYYILFVYLNDNFSLIGNIEDVLQPKYFNARNRHNWNNFYLAEKKIVDEIDFNEFVNDIDNRVSDKIEESYSFNFKSYLSRFLINDNIDILDLVFPICEKIVNDEFELYLDLDENLIFKRNTVKQVYEYAYEALVKLGKPSKVQEIFEKVLELYPNYDTEKAKIRSSMKRKDGFVPIGRKSVFGLKKWENEIENFKGGTIRSIVEEYLSQFSAPSHISDITDHVLKYRPKSNQYSILQNLKLDESGLYVFFKGSNIGLSFKKYEDIFKKLSESERIDKKSWKEWFEILQNFTTRERRLPFSTGVPPNEIKLYRWLNVQKGRIRKGKLDINKTSQINEIVERFPTINGVRRQNSKEKYQELISFVLDNHRLPSPNKNGEEKLYHFFYKQRKLFDINELETLEESKFIEVAKLLQNINYENKRN